MNEKTENRAANDLETARRKWSEAYHSNISGPDGVRNRSGIEIQPLYTPADWSGERYLEEVGMPGREPYTRGVYATMHRGRSWSQRQLVGLGFPKDYNERVRTLLGAGASAISLLPCNSGFRGYDCDEVPSPLLGTCGTVVNCVDHMQQCLEEVPFERISTALNDPSPFTLLAFMLATAQRHSIPWSRISGTSNQSDYLSHCVANHMFFRLALPGARRILVDHIDFCSKHLPRWHPVSVVGQHMQQAGATPAQAMGFTISTAIQYADDCQRRGMDMDVVLRQFGFFFDISISFFEEIAKFRAARRIWARIVAERFGAKHPNSRRFKFHGQTSGADLTLQQPLNNVARVTTQAIAGILSGLQSMHTDAWDEAISSPSEGAARIAIATQNILRDEAGLCDVIDPLGGSYYVERLTDQMEEEIRRVITDVDDAGGMYKAVESGMVQLMIGKSALEFQRTLETGERKLVGVNCFKLSDEIRDQTSPYRPSAAEKDEFLERFKRFKADRSQTEVRRALDALARAANSREENVFERVVSAAQVGVTHGEIVGKLREELGFGHPVIIA
ncbi:MAG TPA: acyl-CoA mutase large subunit family protein [Steroidobacteraceae bacterium]